MPKPAPSPRTPLEERVFNAAKQARAGEPVPSPIPAPPPLRSAVVVACPNGLWFCMVVELKPDGRWLELSRTTPKSRPWAESECLDAMRKLAFERGRPVRRENAT